MIDQNQEYDAKAHMRDVRQVLYGDPNTAPLLNTMQEATLLIEDSDTPNTELLKDTLQAIAAIVATIDTPASAVAELWFEYQNLHPPHFPEGRPANQRRVMEAFDWRFYEETHGLDRLVHAAVSQSAGYDPLLRQEAEIYLIPDGDLLEIFQAANGQPAAIRERVLAALDHRTADAVAIQRQLRDGNEQMTAMLQAFNVAIEPLEQIAEKPILNVAALLRYVHTSHRALVQYGDTISSDLATLEAFVASAQHLMPNGTNTMNRLCQNVRALRQMEVLTPETYGEFRQRVNNLHTQVETFRTQLLPKLTTFNASNALGFDCTQEVLAIQHIIEQADNLRAIHEGDWTINTRVSLPHLDNALGIIMGEDPIATQVYKAARVIWDLSPTHQALLQELLVTFLDYHTSIQAIADLTASRNPLDVAIGLVRLAEVISALRSGTPITARVQQYMTRRDAVYDQIETEFEADFGREGRITNMLVARSIELGEYARYRERQQELSQKYLLARAQHDAVRSQLQRLHMQLQAAVAEALVGKAEC